MIYSTAGLRNVRRSGSAFRYGIRYNGFMTPNRLLSHFNPKNQRPFRFLAAAFIH